MQPLLTINSVTVGIAPPPPGVTPNFDHPESIGYLAVVSVIVCLLLATFALLLRLYTRHFITHIIGADDYLIIAALLISLGFTVCTIHLVGLGVGTHLWNIPKTNALHMWTWSIVQGVFFGLSVMFAKISILQFYLRISPHRYFKIIIHVLSAVIVIYSLVASFDWLYVCQPMAKYWDPTILHGSCMDVFIIWVFNAVMNSLTDIFMIFLPVLMLWNVRIPRRQKIAVIGILTMGSFVFIVSIIRLAYIIILRRGVLDLSWESVKPIIWAVVELYIGVTCACLPHVKPLIQRHFPRLLRSTIPQTNSRTVRSTVFNETGISNHKDISLSAVARGGEAASTGDAESQRAILDEDNIYVRSDIHVMEEPCRQGEHEFSGDNHGKSSSQ